MKLFCMFHIGAKAILEKNCTVMGTVTKRTECTWCKINTKAIRRDMLDGALFPHIITFTYTVDAVPYQGKLWVGVRYRAPEKGESLRICYDPESPEKYACNDFGPGPYQGVTWR